MVRSASMLWSGVDPLLECKETSMAMLNLDGIDALVGATIVTSLDLGDWLCQVMGICA